MGFITKVAFPPPRRARSECSLLSMTGAGTDEGGAPSIFALHQRALNSLNRFLRQKAQGLCPADRAVASSRKKSSE